MLRQGDNKRPRDGGEIAVLDRGGNHLAGDLFGEVRGELCGEGEVSEVIGEELGHGGGVR